MTNNTTCNFETIQIVSTPAFRIALLVYFVIGLVSRLFLAFHKQYKMEKENAYSYQILDASIEIVEVLVDAL